MANKKATTAIIRNLHNEHPDYYLHEVWEHMSLQNLEVFKENAWRWLFDKSDLRNWSNDNADWEEVYAHFVSEAARQIDEHNGLTERQPDEDPKAFLQRVIEEREMEHKWEEYNSCNTCGIGAGLQCVNKRSGKPAKNPHSGRTKVGAELAQDEPVQEVAPTTPAKRKQRPAVDSAAVQHGMTITPGNVAGHSTFRATCSCGQLNGSNITSRYLAEQEYQRHLESTLVPA